MSIQSKLILTFTVVGILLMLAAYWLMQRSFDQGVVDYINQRQTEQFRPFAELLADYYAESGTWQPLRNNPDAFHRAFREFIAANNEGFFVQTPRAVNTQAPLNSDRFRPRENLRLDQRRRPPIASYISLVDADKKFIYGRRFTSKDKTALLDINVNRATVGFLVLPKISADANVSEVSFIQGQKQQLLLVCLLIISVTMAIAWLLAKHFVKPIQHLAKVTNAVKQGDLKIKSAIHRSDEIGDLSRQLDNMIQQLDNAEQSRRRWVADFSHELRTPLAILRGEIEAILDGVRQADKNNIQSLEEETKHLQKLIDDLYQLSNEDTGELKYHMFDCDLIQLLTQLERHHQARFASKNLTLTFNIECDSADIIADETRLQQLLDNLLNNSFKYTDAGGEVSLTLTQKQKHYQITIEDSLPGVSDSDLPKLFDYLYRTEASRNRKTGGSGLGLAICQRIVAAHGGNIQAKHAKLGGLAIVIKIPNQKKLEHT